MGEMQDMGNDFMDFVKSYSFKDKKEVYTNGIELVPLFRVQQAYDYYISKLEKLERAFDKACDKLQKADLGNTCDEEHHKQCRENHCFKTCIHARPLTKEECLKALCRIQCGAKRNKKCEDCKCFDTKINPWKCVENTNESLIIRDLIEEHFNPQPLKFEDLKENMWVYDRTYKLCRQVHKFYSNGSRDVIQFKSDHYPKLAEAYFFEEDRYYPIQIPNVGGEE